MNPHKMCNFANPKKKCVMWLVIHSCLLFFLNLETIFRNEDNH